MKLKVDLINTDLMESACAYVWHSTLNHMNIYDVLSDNPVKYNALANMPNDIDRMLNQKKGLIRIGFK